MRKRMRKRMRKAAECLLLGTALCVGLGGCSGREYQRIETKAELNSGKDAKTPDTVLLQTAENERQDNENGDPGEKDGNAGTDFDGTGDSSADGKTGNKTQESGDRPDALSDYLYGADMNGRVLDFTDDGFKLLAIHAEVFEDGSINTWEAAPGYEKEEDMLYVICTEETVFEVQTCSLSQQKELSRETCGREDVKKQQVIYVWGASEDGKTWTADQVMVQKWK